MHDCRTAWLVCCCFLTIVTHGPCWGLHTERKRHSAVSHTGRCVLILSLFLSLSLSQLLSLLEDQFDAIRATMLAGPTRGDSGHLVERQSSFAARTVHALTGAACSRAASARAAPAAARRPGARRRPFVCRPRGDQGHLVHVGAHCITI